MRKRANALDAIAEIEAALEQARKNDDANTINYLTEQLNIHKQASLRIKSKRVEYNGVKYSSELEAYFAKRCDDLAIMWERQVTIELQPAFILFGEKVPPIKIRVDFLVEGFAFVDPKGMLMPDFEIKWNMLKNKFKEDYEYHLPQSKKQIEELLAKLIK